MTEQVPRRLYRSTARSPGEALEILSGLFVAELINSSRELWIVSPWISDIGVIGNESGQFDGLNPAWGRRSIALSEVLTRLAQMGTDVRVVTRPDARNDDFLEHVHALDEGRLVHTVERHQLHEKGILGDGFHLAGSMNITFFGININEEALTFMTDAHLVSEAHLEYAKRYRDGWSDA